MHSTVIDKNNLEKQIKWVIQDLKGSCSKGALTQYLARSLGKGDAYDGLVQRLQMKEVEGAGPLVVGVEQWNCKVNDTRYHFALVAYIVKGYDGLEPGIELTITLKERQLKQNIELVRSTIHIPIGEMMDRSKYDEIDHAQGIDRSENNRAMRGDVVLIDDETEALLYGHTFLKAASSGNGVTEGTAFRLPAEAWIAVLGCEFKHVPEVKAYLDFTERTKTIYNKDLLEAIDAKLQLPVCFFEHMRQVVEGRAH